MQLSSSAPRLLSQSHPLPTSLALNGDIGLKVEPTSIQFDSVQSGVLYVMSFSVRNITKVAQRIRIQSPKTGFFALNYIPSGPIAPGLDIRGEIECQIPENSKDLIFTDKIVATMGTHEIELHLYASKPHAIVQFDKSIHFGNLIRGTTTTKDLVFTNEGLERGSVKLSLSSECDFKINPLKFDLSPKGLEGSTIVAKLTMDAKKTGLHREVVKVSVSGALEDQILDVSAQVIEQTLTLIAENKNGKLENANFGNIFFGQSRSITSYLVNSGPEPLNFMINFDEEDDARDTSSQASTSDAPQTDDNNNSKYITVSPLDGMVKPFSQFPITLTFSPKYVIPGKGFMKQQIVTDREEKPFSRKVSIECAELGSKIPLNMQGVSIIPCVTLSSSVLRFGDCPINDRRDIIVNLINKTKFSTKFSLPTVANFKFCPSHGVLQSLQTVSVIASFLPPQLGEFKSVVKMSLADGLEYMDIRMMGQSSEKVKKILIGGTDKLPEDFQTRHKFVDPEEEEAARLEKKKDNERKVALQSTLTKAMNKASLSNNNVDDSSLNSAKSAERNEVYGTEDEDTFTLTDVRVGVDGVPVVMDKNHPTFLKKKNDQIYDSYLRDSHIRRIESKKTQTLNKLVARGAINPTDPFNINMGMEKGLDEPDLKIPQATEPLWLANSRGNGSDGAGASRLPTDENRLINKKYSATPATQAEIRDCTAELTLEQMKLVCGSHKIIDFGKVCVGSLAAKNFVISNDLTQSVMINILELESELSQSRPACQIIPQGCVAGFDIYFSSKTISKYKKTFTWTINNNHIFKVVVIAEIVPIELVLSTNHLQMFFPDDSFNPTLTEDVIMTNPGNAVAEFLWGSAGAFQCSPEQGSIGPGKSTMISINWSPLLGKRHEEELGLHISGGVDQTLLVTGVLHETQAEFVEKRIMLGTMAVGTEKKVSVQMKNTGNCPLVYFMNPTEEKMGITINPEKNLIEPGDVFVIEVSITPRSPMNYDNTVISAKIRGGKQISFKLAGSSVIPQLTVLEDSYDFGKVVVGGEIRLPMTIQNKSAIPSTLILDLASYPDFKPFMRNTSEEIETSSQEIPNEQEDAMGNQVKIMGIVVANNDAKKSRKKQYRNIWSILLIPNSTLTLDFIFRPTSQKQYKFKMQLYLQGIQEDKSLNREVKAIGLSTVLDISSFVIDFGDRVVSRDPLSRVPYYLETTFKNVGSKGGISYQIKELDDVTKEYADKKPSTSSGNSKNDLIEAPQIFFISPVKGDLPPGASTKIRVTFQPQSSGDYSKKLEIYVTDQPDPSRPYLTIVCQGSGVFPRLTFSKQNIQLPTVPLGITSRTTFTIFNNGYNSLHMNYKISPNIPVPLEIIYPEGDEIGIMIEKIKVVVGAKSDFPISWTGKIEFYDQDGERFCISVSGCSDSCLLTNYPFVRDYNSDYGFIGLDDQPVKFLKKSQIAELRALESKRKEELRKQRSLERLKAVENSNKDATTTNGKSEKRDQSPSPPRNKLNKNKNTSANSAKNLLESASEMSLEGIDIERINDEMIIDDFEISFLLKWLNKNICRKPFDLEHFPDCIVNSQGDLVVDCIEQMSGRRIQFSKLSDGTNDKNTSKQDALVAAVSSNKKNSERNKKIFAANRLVYKMQQILNFLINNGALLGHINPVTMVGLDEHLLAQEFELTKDKSIRYTPAMLSDRRNDWENLWLAGCKNAWQEVLYQSIKSYVLTRINYTEYSTMPGVVIAPKDEKLYQASLEVSSKSKSKKKKGPYIPKDLIPSNVFTHAEAVLLAWVSYHLDRAAKLPDAGASATSTSEAVMISFNKRVTDIDVEFKDMTSFLRLIHSHIPSITNPEEILTGYTSLTTAKKDETHEVLESVLKYLKMDLESSVLEVVSSMRSLLLMIMHLFLTLPSLIPKSKIEFVGNLGDPIAKNIELKNPSKRKVSYEVVLKGSIDFSIGSTFVTIPPESNINFVVNLHARFCDPVNASLIFWGVKEGGLAGPSTLVFQLESRIIGRKPIGTISKKMTLYEMETIPIHIKNPFPKDGVFQVRLQISQTLSTIEDFLKAPGKSKKKSDPKLLNLSKCPTDTSDLTPREKKMVEDDWEIERLFRTPFWCVEETVTLVKGTKSLNLFMLPFVMGTYTCQLVLIEKDIGEFCYEVNVEVGLPKSSDKLDFSASTGSQITKAIRIGSKNMAFEKAFTIITESRIKNPNKKIKARSVLHNFVSSPVVDEDTGQSNFVIEFLSSFFSYKKQLPFVSEYTRAKQSTVTNTSATNTDSKRDTHNNNNNAKKYQKMPKTMLEDPAPEEYNTTLDLLNSCLLTFHPDKAGHYNSLAVVFSKDNHFDIRVFEVTSTVTMPDGKMILEFIGPARQPIYQDIPITNESDRDWLLTTSVRGESDAFTCPKSVTVPKGMASALQVTFLAPHAGKFDGFLQLKNTEMGDTFQYGLMGLADEPLAEDHLTFRCMARQPHSFSIPIKQVTSNNNKKKTQTQAADLLYEAPQVFVVETDLPHLTGPETVSVRGLGSSNYNFVILSPVGGIFSGYISFRDTESDATAWFTVTVEVTAPAEERTISVESVVRKAVAVEITLDNPTDEVLLFDVFVEGEGLLGESTFELPVKNSNKSSIYELIFSPLLTGEYSGRISFSNDKVGLVWYKLSLRALPAEAVELEAIESMLGSTGSLQAPVENPLPESVTFSISVSDPDHFELLTDKLTLAGYEQSSFQVTFRPSSLNETVTGLVTLTNPQFGEIQYLVSGVGLLPGIMPVVVVDAPLGEIGSQTIVFRNPFTHPLPVDVVLTCPALEIKTVNPRTRGNNNKGISTALKEKQQQDFMLEAFSLLTKKSLTGLVVPSKSSLHIPVGFTPQKLGYYESVVELRSSVSGRHLLWCYPIRGVAEAGSAVRLPLLKTSCKSQVMREELVPLEGIGRDDVLLLSEDLKLSDFSVDLIVDEETARPLVLRSFRAQPLEVLQLQQDTDPNTFFPAGKGPSFFGLRLRLLFEPLKLLSTRVQVLLQCRGRGKWRLQIDLEASEPEPDDRISFCAPVGGADKVTFRLTNRFLGFSRFQAYFLSKSSPHFSVSPSSGSLPPFGSSEGFPFTVTFKPKEYGAIEVANLMIVTDEAQWNYEMHGSYPDVNHKNNNVKSKIGQPSITNR